MLCYNILIFLESKVMHINLSEKNKPPATVISDFLASGEKLFSIKF